MRVPVIIEDVSACELREMVKTCACAQCKAHRDKSTKRAQEMFEALHVVNRGTIDTCRAAAQSFGLFGVVLIVEGLIFGLGGQQAALAENTRNACMFVMYLFVGIGIGSGFVALLTWMLMPKPVVMEVEHERLLIRPEEKEKAET